MIRTIYSCDWCLVDASKTDHVDDDWEEVDSQLLCADCFGARQEAILEAKRKIEKAGFEKEAAEEMAEAEAKKKKR